jgi:hypothetical protein
MLKRFGFAKLKKSSFPHSHVGTQAANILGTDYHIGIMCIAQTVKQSSSCMKTRGSFKKTSENL